MRLSLIALFCALLKTTCNSLSTLQIRDHGIGHGGPEDDLHQQLQLQQQEVMKLTLPFLQKTLMRIYQEIKSDPQFLELHISKEDTNALLELITHDRVTLPQTTSQNGVSSTRIPEFLVTLALSLIFVLI
eukprot:04294.XXX_128160_128817_1 [CDS] Oithona nana genome sequencing.